MLTKHTSLVMCSGAERFKYKTQSLLCDGRAINIFLSANKTNK